MVKWTFLVTLLFIIQEHCVQSGRSKRSTCHAKFNAIPDHSACLAASSSLQKSGLSDDDREAIVEEHNKFRSQVSPTASGMMKMSWDEEVELVAQKYADACKVNQHDGNRQRSIPGRFSVGQNLASASSNIGWAGVVQLWHSEVKDFNTNGNNILSVVGHYTQVVWADSIKLGCGYALCGSTHNYVCNYAPGGNFDINTPYKRGTSCSDCPGHCSNKLCDCDGLACQNGGTMDKSTCTCTCKTPQLYFGRRCDLNCSVSDPSFPCDQYTASQCNVYSNVPQDCPAKCNVCPYAGVSPETTTKSSDDSTVTTVRPTTRSPGITVSTDADATQTTPIGSGYRVLPSWFLYFIIILMGLNLFLY